MIIAVDGPAASGKGTIARRLAAHYALPYLDTGLLYRGFAHAMLQHGHDADDAAVAFALARGLDVEALDDEALRTAQGGAMASGVAGAARGRGGAPGHPPGEGPHPKGCRRHARSPHRREGAGSGEHRG